MVLYIMRIHCRFTIALLCFLIGMVTCTGCTQFQGNDIETAKAHLCRLAEAQRDYMNATGHVAIDLNELISSEHTRHLELDKTILTDPWGSKLDYVSKGGEICSLGPDRKLRSDDDLAITSYNYRNHVGPIQTDEVY